MGGGFIANGGLTPPSPLPTSPRQKETIEIKINYQSFDLPSDVAKSDVIKALSGLRADPEYARELKKEFILNADLLIELMNTTKLEVQHKRPHLSSDGHCYDSIELAFIENKHLSVYESEWVRETIDTYKLMVKRTVAQNSPKPITPPPSVISVATSKKCSCAIA
jgi:hypothetical protein